MNTQKKIIAAMVVLFAALTLPFPAAQAEEEPVPQPDQTVISEAESQAAETQAVQADVETQTEAEVSDKRSEIIREAVGALAETKTALQALEEEKTEEALAALEKVTGKLTLIIAREPELAFAPVDVSVVTHDLYAQPETVKAQVRLAEELLEDGAVQAARELLAALASETRIRTSHIPLATYPDAIKNIVPLIDAGEIDKAKSALQLALNTLVVTEQVIPLPIVRASVLLGEAEELAENDERTIKQNEDLAGMLDAARTQVKLAQALGYGEKRQFKPMLEDIKTIEEKTQGGKSGWGFFDTIKKKIAEF